MDYYAELGVAVDASPEEVQAAFRRAARRWHPDVCARPDAAERMRRLNEAYAVLRDPGRRATYDQTRGRLVAGQVAPVWTVRPTAQPRATSGQPGAAAPAAAAAYDQARRVAWASPGQSRGPTATEYSIPRHRRVRHVGSSPHTAARRTQRQRARMDFADVVQRVARVGAVQLLVVLAMSVGVLALARYGSMASAVGPGRPSQRGAAVAVVAAAANSHLDQQRESPSSTEQPVSKMVQAATPGQLAPLPPLPVPRKPLAPSAPLPPTAPTVPWESQVAVVRPVTAPGAELLRSVLVPGEVAGPSTAVFPAPRQPLTPAQVAPFVAPAPVVAPPLAPSQSQ